MLLFTNFSGTCIKNSQPTTRKRKSSDLQTRSTARCLVVSGFSRSMVRNTDSENRETSSHMFVKTPRNVLQVFVVARAQNRLPSFFQFMIYESQNAKLYVCYNFSCIRQFLLMILFRINTYFELPAYPSHLPGIFLPRK